MNSKSVFSHLDFRHIGVIEAIIVRFLGKKRIICGYYVYRWRGKAYIMGKQAT
jgi:hypothetical protein